MKYLKISAAQRAASVANATALGAVEQGGVTRKLLVGDLSPLGSVFDPAGDLFRFGDGRDGDVTVSTVVTLTRDMYYNNLTLVAGGVINTANFRIYVKGTLNLTACDARAICNLGASSIDRTSNQPLSQSGTASAAAASLGAGQTGGASGGGTNNAVPTAPAVLAAYDPANGGRGGAISGEGGGDGVNAGGVGRASIAPVQLTVVRLTHDLLRGATLIGGGAGGPGGGGGRGSGTTGGGGGAGGSGAGVIFISARTLSVGPSTPVSAICARGGKGSAGSTVTTGNRGGGGGGAGGGGGYVHLTIKTLIGTAVNAVGVEGGDGGAGGNGFGTGIGGRGGDGGYGGRIVLINLDAETCTHFSATSSSGAPGGDAVGVTGGPGGAGFAARMSL